MVHAPANEPRRGGNRLLCELNDSRIGRRTRGIPRNRLPYELTTNN